jgi:hypothetical protein
MRGSTAINVKAWRVVRARMAHLLSGKGPDGGALRADVDGDRRRLRWRSFLGGILRQRLNETESQ